MNIQTGLRQEALHATAAARLVEAAAAAMAKVPVEGLRSRSRGCGPVARARQRAMYLSHVVFGLSFTRIGICFGRDRTTVRHACRLVEEERDAPAREFGLAALEAALASLTHALELEPAR